MFRVYDIEHNEWITEGCFMDAKENLHIAEKTFFGNVKLNLVLSDRYIYQYAIGLTDKNRNQIYEGDICKSTNNNFGIISFNHQFASYVLYNPKKNKHFVLSEKICSNNLEVIGNVFDIPDEYKNYIEK